jgi:hypothetical protein
MPEEQEQKPQAKTFPMDIATLHSFNEMQQNMAQALRLIMRNSGNPGTRNEAEVMLGRISANIQKTEQWLADAEK